MPFSKTLNTGTNKVPSASSIFSTSGGRRIFGHLRQEHKANQSNQRNAFAHLAENDPSEPQCENDEKDVVDDYAAMKEEIDHLKKDSTPAIFGSASSSTKAPKTVSEDPSNETDIQVQDWETVKGRERQSGRAQALGPVWRARTNKLLTSNWRTGKTVNASGYTAPKIADARSYARVGRTNYTGAPVGNGVNADDLYPGAIVWHKDVRECHDENAIAKEGEELFKSPEGQDIMRKGRYFVVTKVCERHLNEVPMYGYNKLGITKKHERIKKQHVGVRPLHILAKDYKKQNELAPLEISLMKDAKEKMHEMTVLHYMEQRSTSFETPMRIVGYLKPDSTERLRKLRADAGC